MNNTSEVGVERTKTTKAHHTRTPKPKTSGTNCKYTVANNNTVSTAMDSERGSHMKSNLTSSPVSASELHCDNNHSQTLLIKSGLCTENLEPSQVMTIRWLNHLYAKIPSLDYEDVTSLIFTPEQGARQFAAEFSQNAYK